jgi:GNAT superfamily N-acetyltransferase
LCIKLHSVSDLNLFIHKELTLSLVFRTIEAEDYPAATEIHNAQNEPDFHYTPEALKHLDERLARRDPCAHRYVAVQDGEVVATVYRRHNWGRMRYPGRYWVGLHTRHDHQRQGVDTQLLYHALKDLEPPAQEVWTVIRQDFLEQAGFIKDEGFEEQGRTWGAHLDLETFEAERFRDVQRRLEADGIRFLPYQTLDDPEKHAKVQALHAEAKRDMPLFEPVATAEFDDVEDEATLPETVMVAVTDSGEIVGVSSVDRGGSMLHSGLTAITAPYRYRGIGRVLKALSAAAAKDLGHTHINSGGAGTDTPILRVNHALGLDIEPAWLTLASRR